MHAFCGLSGCKELNKGLKAILYAVQTLFRVHTAVRLQGDQTMHGGEQQSRDLRFRYFRQTARGLALFNDCNELRKGSDGGLLQLALLRGNSRVIKQQTIACRMLNAEVDYDLESLHKLAGRLDTTLTYRLEAVGQRDEVCRSDSSKQGIPALKVLIWCIVADAGCVRDRSQSDSLLTAAVE